MSKEIISSEVGFSVHGYRVENFSKLEGKVRTIIEAMDLPLRQSKASTDLIINELWSLWDNPKYSYNYELVGNKGEAVLRN